MQTLASTTRGGQTSGIHRPDYALAAVAIYFAITLSKKFWLPALDGAYFWMADVACFVFLPATLVAVLKLPLRPGFAVGHFKSRTLATNEAVYLALLTLLGLWVLSKIGLVIGVSVARHYPDALPQVIDYVGHIPKTGGASVLVTVYFAITAGVVEEYVFRGLLASVCGHYFRRNSWVFVMASTLSFAAIHWGGGLANVVAAFIQGILLTVVYLRCGDLRIPLLAHTLIWLRLLF